jgi:hypothetical protein
MIMPALAKRRKRFFSSARSPKPLIVRAGLARTFGSLGSFTAILFLGAGIYLLRESFADPLTAQSVGVISGAVVIALATMLIYFLVSPRARSRGRKARHHRDDRIPAIALSVPSPAGPSQEDASKELVMQV